MDVELAQERMLLLADRFSMDHAEGRAWTKRTDAFGTMAKIGSFLSRPKDEDFETVDPNVVQVEAGAALYFGHGSSVIDAAALAKAAADGAVVVPPQAKAAKAK